MSDLSPNVDKVRDIAAALEIAAWLNDHRDVADDQLLLAGTLLLQRFESRGWQVSRIDRPEIAPGWVDDGDGYWRSVPRNDRLDTQP